MYEINKLDDMRGNNVVIYSIKTLLERKQFPKLSIMSGVMGVGKTSVARVIARELNDSDMDVQVYNFGMSVDMQRLSEEVFSLKPAKPRAFIFEEIHAMPRNDQNALLQMFDTQSPNVYIICTTTEIQKVLRTIRSRAHVWEFKLLSDKQLSALLDDYLASKGATLTEQSKQSLLKACRGVPRDLINNTDFALAGDFSSVQLDALLGNVSDELMYSIFCSLKSSPVDFVVHIEDLMDEVSSTKLQAMSDFWLRYLLERSGAVRKTLTSAMIQTLDSTYSQKERNQIAKLLLRATPETLLLELVSLNMSLTDSTQATILGQQRDISQDSQQQMRMEKQQGKGAMQSARLSAAAIREMKL